MQFVHFVNPALRLRKVPSDLWGSSCFKQNHSVLVAGRGESRLRSTRCFQGSARVHHQRLSPRPSFFSCNHSIFTRHITSLSSSLVAHEIFNGTQPPLALKSPERQELNPRWMRRGERSENIHEVSDSSKCHLPCSNDWMEMSQMDHCNFLVLPLKKKS